MVSTLDNLSDGLLRPKIREARLCFTESYIFSGDGTPLVKAFRGGKHAAKRPTETSAVVQKVGAVLKLLLLPFAGSK